MRILIIGESIRSLAYILTLQNTDKSLTLDMISDKTEVGLSDELQPGCLVADHPILPVVRHHIPENTKNSTFLRHSWVLRGMAIQAINQGLNLHLRSAEKTIENGASIFEGKASESFRGPIQFDLKYKSDGAEIGNVWHGSVNLIRNGDSFCFDRGDGTFEHWTPKKDEGDGNLQTGRWIGIDPRFGLKSAIESGIHDAHVLLKSLK